MDNAIRLTVIWQDISQKALGRCLREMERLLQETLPKVLSVGEADNARTEKRAGLPDPRWDFILQ